MLVSQLALIKLGKLLDCERQIFPVELSLYCKDYHTTVVRCHIGSNCVADWNPETEKWEKINA